MRLLVLFLLAAAAFGQSLDRLILRPRAQNTEAFDAVPYLPGAISFCGSTDWPSADPECVGIQSPSEVDRYNLYWPLAAPELPSCVAVNAIGQMSFVACGEGVVQLNPADAVFPKSTAQARLFTRHRNVASIGGASYLELLFEAGDRALWVFSVPPGFSNQPELKVWGEAVDENDEWEASLRCVIPNTTGNWSLQPFDTENVGAWQSAAASNFNLMVIPLINDGNMDPGDLCHLDLALAASSGQPKVFYMEVY